MDNKMSMILLTVCSVVAFVSCKTPPKFVDQYQVDGVMYLPYAEIAEPFTAYYDAKANLSRISYYNGMMETLQLASHGKHGVAKLYVYISNNTHLNMRTCMQANGDVNHTVQIQDAMPDLTGFQYIGKDTCHSDTETATSCDTWRRVTIRWGTTTTDTIWVKETANGFVPVRYEMIGYNSLFGSHYDRYYVTYKNFKFGPVDPSNFDIEKTVKCQGSEEVTGPTDLANPIKDLLDKDDSIVDGAFEEFKTKHGKSYRDETEHHHRKNTFRNNFRFIHSTNRQGRTFTLAVNHLADYSQEELKNLRGRLPSQGYNGGAPFEDKVDMETLPAFWDWRYYGAVTPVKDQAVCGSCWSFGATGVIEGAHFLKEGKRTSLSEQQLVDCSWGQGNMACNGGFDFWAYQYIMKNGGIEADSTYGPYLGADGKCHHKKSKSVVQIKSYVNVTSGDLLALKTAVHKRGPISVAIDAAVPTFYFYSNGVYYDEKCGNTPNDLDHAVLAVGFGELEDESYWLIKNSWSSYWGSDGYVLISQKDNNCGVATQATFPILA